MKTINKIANKLGLRKPRYHTLMVRTKDYISFKAFAAEHEKTHVDFFKEMLIVYLECKDKKHDAIIANLENQRDVLVDELKLYYKRVGRIYRSPADKTPKSSRDGGIR